MRWASKHGGIIVDVQVLGAAGVCPMIELENVTYFAKRLRRKGSCVLAGASLKIPGGRHLALLGEPFEHVKFVIDLLAGVAIPSTGRIARGSSVSFLAGDVRMFVPELSVRRNVQHVARLYAEDHQAIIGFVQRCLGLGQDFDRPFGALPRSVQKVVSHVIAYAIPFNIYILSETLKGGKGGLNDVAFEVFKARVKNCGFIAPMRDVRFAKEFCDGALVLQANQLKAFDNLEEAIKALG